MCDGKVFMFRYFLIKMKILAIGDPHGDLKKLKDISMKGVDLILLTGDLSKATLARKRFFENIERNKEGLSELEDTIEFEVKCYMESYSSAIAVLKYCSRFAPVYFISGNADPSTRRRVRMLSKKIGEELPYFVSEIKKMNNVLAINNRVVNFNGVRIGGLEYFIDTNWVKEFKPNNYHERMIRARRQSDKARGILKWFSSYNLDILLHHQPPYGFLDEVGGAAPKHWHGKHAGSKIILDYLKRKQPKYSFCGHIHEGEGKKKIGKTEVYNLGVAGHKIVEFN